MKIDFTPLAVTKDEPLRLEIESFIECVVERREPRVTGVQALRALEVACAILGKLKSIPVWSPRTVRIAQGLKTAADRDLYRGSRATSAAPKASLAWRLRRMCGVWLANLDSWPSHSNSPARPPPTRADLKPDASLNLDLNQPWREPLTPRRLARAGVGSVCFIS